MILCPLSTPPSFTSDDPQHSLACRHSLLSSLLFLLPHPSSLSSALPPPAAADPSSVAGLGENKRQGLIPFPRVGRSENAEPRAMPAAWLVAPEFYPGKRGEREAA